MRRPPIPINSAPPDPPKGMFAEHAAVYRALGYSPIPVFPGGKRPIGWTQYCLEAATPEKIKDWGGYSPSPNIALACGYKGLVAIDVDVSDIAIITAVLDALPHCRIARFGSKGFALLCRYVGNEKRCSGRSNRTSGGKRRGHCPATCLFASDVIGCTWNEREKRRRRSKSHKLGRTMPRITNRYVSKRVLLCIRDERHEGAGDAAFRSATHQIETAFGTPCHSLHERPMQHWLG